MCGIVGYLGNQAAYPILLDGLKKVEYRGYDSYGIYMPASFPRDSDFAYPVVHYTSLGKIADAPDRDYPHTSGIAHTRWATHGKVCHSNCHPVCSQYGRIVVAHNGIIPNVHKLRNLIPEKIGDETDTHVFVALLEYYQKRYDTNTVEGMHRVISRVARFSGGDNAFLIYIPRYHNTFFVATTGNRILYFSDTGHFASDVNAIRGKASIVYPIQNQTVSITYNPSDNSYDMSSQIKGITIEDISEQSETTTEHFMLSEIREQVKKLRGFGFNPPNNFVFTNPKKVVLTGCGSSYYAAMMGRKAFESIANLPTQVEYASEFPYGLVADADNTLFIGISQSGETKDTLDALSAINPNNVLCITNNHLSHMALKWPSVSIDAGVENGVAATKTFFRTVLMLIDIASRYKSEIARITNKSLDELLGESVQQILNREEQFKEFAGVFSSQFNNFLFLGTGYTYPIALEGALKLKEVSYLRADGMPAAEMKHGPIAVVDNETLAIFVINRLSDSIISNISQIKSRGGNILVICDELDPLLFNITGEADYLVKMPNLLGNSRIPVVSDSRLPLLQALISNIPLQLLAYYMSVAAGLNPDRPRNLAKSVTV